jgi:selenocysteine lyase/cysteine desulfurase
MHRRLNASSLTRGKMNTVVGSKFTATNWPHKYDKLNTHIPRRGRLVQALSVKLILDMQSVHAHVTPSNKWLGLDDDAAIYH